MTDYIITEEELREFEEDANDDTYGGYDTERGDKIRSRTLFEALKAERERVCNVLITKLDACISSCPSDARQKPKTILKRCKETIESLRSEP